MKKYEVICNFYGMQEKKNFEVGDYYITEDASRAKKLIKLGLVKEVEEDYQGYETKEISPKKRSMKNGK
jgi:hypothetical protein